jgi:PAS domain S-box-containing protein
MSATPTPQHKAALPQTPDRALGGEAIELAVLNGISGQIAVLAPDGTIIAVNEAWRQFAGENDAPDHNAFVGWNYLAVCESAASSGDHFAREMENGIRAVLSGKKMSFYGQYACVSKGVKRWFSVTVNTLRPHGGGAVVRHSDITRMKEGTDAILQERQRLELLSQTAPVLIWMCDRDAKCTFFNQRWMEHTGRTLEEELGDGWVTAVHPDDRAHVMKVFREAFADRVPFEIEYRLRNAKGEYPWMVDRGVAFYAGRTFEGYIGSVIDISEQKKALQEAKRESAHIKLLADVSSAAHQAEAVSDALESCLELVCKNLKWPFAYGELWNPDSALRGSIAGAVCAIHASKRNHLAAAAHRRVKSYLNRGQRGRQQKAVFLPIDRKIFTPPQQESLRSIGVRSAIALPIVIGQRAAGLVTFASTGDARDRHLRKVIDSIGLELQHLITRIQTERALEISDRQYRAFFEQTTVGASQLTPNGRFVRVNKAMTRITGYSRHELLRMRFSDLTHPDDRQTNQQFHRILDGDISGYTLEMRIKRKNGEVALVQIDATAIRDREGKPQQVAAIWQDVTERKVAVQKLMSANKDVELLAARLNTAQEEERARIARELHDGIGQDATGLVLSLALLRDSAMQTARKGEHAEALDQQFQKIHTSASQLVRDIRTLSHGLHPAVLEFGGLVSSLRSLCDEYRKHALMKVDFNVEEGLEVEDKHLALGLYRIVQEALQNVLRHAKTRAVSIHLMTWAHGILRLTIKDFGVGFDPNAVRKSQGLGMISMEERTRILGGTFQVTTNVQRGTEIVIEIPQKINVRRERVG